MKTIFKIAIIVAVVVSPLVFWGNIKSVFKPLPTDSTHQVDDFKKEKGDQKTNKEKKDKKKKDKAEVVSSDVKVLNKWDLPFILTEISGLEYLGNNKFACIQDEDGTIFIFDADQNKVVKQIPFAGPGDYEGISIEGSTAYVVRSDGRIFEVRDYDDTEPTVREYATHLTSHNVEGLCYDKKNNRLLVAIKGKEPNSNQYKGIYSFDLASQKMATTPVYKIDLADPVFKEVNAKNIIQPSGIEINPVSGEIYVIEAASPKILIMDESGQKRKLYQMNNSDFKQAEGITFTPQGDLYISNEGKKGAANILKVEIAK
jgi:uncharacterized protein YjiK